MNREQAVRVGDRFLDTDGVWTVIAADFGEIDLQCLDHGQNHGTLIRYPLKAVRTWERVPDQLSGDNNER